jgi:two-component system OmpR family sensor kinase
MRCSEKATPEAVRDRGRQPGGRDACGPPPKRRSAVWWYLTSRLQRRLFFAFGAVILVTGLVASVVTGVLSERGGWRAQRVRLERFAGARFSEVWRDPEGRARLAAAVADELRMRVELRDSSGETLLLRAPAGVAATRCPRPTLRARVAAPGGAVLGEARFCNVDPSWGGGRTALLVLAVLAVIWRMAGGIARRMARPLDDLVEVVRDIGEGRLDRRARLPTHGRSELGLLARVVNDMAARIEAQVAAQRELLAAVSHELRSPLARVRFLLETARADGADVGARSAAISEVEDELVGIDALVGDLLASSRMDFQAMQRVRLDATEVASRALSKAGVDLAALDAPDEALPIVGDATLLTTALVNLIGNAQRHGGGVRALRVRQVGEIVRFEVEDPGGGIPDDELPRIFEPFYRGAGAGRRGGAGLGLALVRRIAGSHGGGVWAANLPGGGGACVGFSVACEAQSAGVASAQR